MTSTREAEQIDDAPTTVCPTCSGVVPVLLMVFHRSWYEDLCNVPWFDTSHPATADRRETTGPYARPGNHEGGSA